MDHFKEGTRIGLKVQTSVGSLTIEQLWGLSMTNLAAAIKAVKKLLQKEQEDSEDVDLAFLEARKPKASSHAQLAFAILKDIYLTKKDEQDRATAAQDKKDRNEKIMAILHAKQGEALSNKTEEELLAMLQE